MKHLLDLSPSVDQALRELRVRLFSLQFFLVLSILIIERRPPDPSTLCVSFVSV